MMTRIAIITAYVRYSIVGEPRKTSTILPCTITAMRARAIIMGVIYLDGYDFIMTEP